jgi:Kef-type K+ transport system membrane component KefB
MAIAFTPVEPLAPHQLLVFLVQVGLLLLCATCLGRLAVRMSMPAIVGELLTGVLLGPSLLMHVAPDLAGWLLPQQPEQVHLLDAAGQLGVLLLVGVTAAQLDLELVRRRSATALRVSLAGLVVPLALGVAIGFLVPGSLLAAGADRTTFACFLGVAMCVSAIPVIAKTLSDMKLMHRDIGQLTLTAGVVDDAVAWLLLSVISAMATIGISAGQISTSVVSLAGFVAVAAFVGRPVVHTALRAAGRSPESGPVIATAVVVIVLGAAATQALGMEAVFGAFVAGLLVGSPRAVDQKRLASLRTMVLSVLAPLFLASAGLRMDLTLLGDPKVLLVAGVVLLVAVLGKFTGTYIGAMASSLGHWERLAIGAGMNARGVVEVVIAMVGLRLGVLNTISYTIVVLVAIVTSLMAPPLLRLVMNHVADTTEERQRLRLHQL